MSTTDVIVTGSLACRHHSRHVKRVRSTHLTLDCLVGQSDTNSFIIDQLQSKICYDEHRGRYNMVDVTGLGSGCSGAVDRPPSSFCIIFTVES